MLRSAQAGQAVVRVGQGCRAVELFDLCGSWVGGFTHCGVLGEDVAVFVVYALDGGVAFAGVLRMARVMVSESGLTEGLLVKDRRGSRRQ